MALAKFELGNSQALREALGRFSSLPADVTDLAKASPSGLNDCGCTVGTLGDLDVARQAVGLNTWAHKATARKQNVTEALSQEWKRVHKLYKSDDLREGRDGDGEERVPSLCWLTWLTCAIT